MAEAKTTTSPDEIRRWVEERGGRPARVKETGGGDDPGILRIDFGEPEESLEEISWDEWLEAFEENRLAFLYDPEQNSRFNKLISRDSND